MDTTVRWTSRQWDEYLEQVRESMPTPEISPVVLAAPIVTPTFFACPICLRDSTSLRMEQAEGGEDATVTWNVCAHRVLVVGAAS